MTTTFLATGTRIVWRLAEARGLDAAAIFRESGLDPANLQEPRGRYSFDRVCRAWARVAALSGNPHLGLEAVKHYRLTDLHALGIAFHSSSTLLSALHRLDRYESIMNSRLNFSVIEKEDRVDLVCDAMGLAGDALRIMEDSRAAIVVDLCRTGTGGTLDPVEVAFTYPQPAQTGEHFALFRCPLRFSAPETCISFARADAQRRFTSAHREIARSNDQILDRLVKSFRQGDLLGKVKEAIIEALPSGTPEDAEIAKAVLLSARTLQRRLAEEGTNYTELLMQVRRELAEQYIGNLDIPVTEISYMLGFSDVSSFSRAFKRWTGFPPAAFRDRAARA